MHKHLFSLLLLLCHVSMLQAQNCSESQAYAILQGNEVKAGFRAGGDFFWDGQGTAQFQVPYSSATQTPHTLFASALWLSATDANSTLQTAIQTYRSRGNDYWTGPLDTNGQTIAATCDDYDRIWQVTRLEIEQHLQDFNNNGVIDGPVPTRILAWPGKGNPQFSAQMGFTLPNQDLAPFYDRNGNGNYEPMLGDYPVYDHNNATAIAEEILWWIFNDNGNLHTESNGQPLKAEVRATAWSFDCQNNDLINRTIFLRHSITNKSGVDWLDFRAGLWNDPDLGCPNDDYTGTDVASNTVYWYNADNNDDNPCGANGTLGYGLNPPVQTMTLLNQTMDRSIYQINSYSSPLGAPTTALGYHRALSGFWPNGTPIASSGNGYDPTYTGPSASHMFPDNPNNPNGWSMYSERLSGLDIRTVSIMEEGTIAAGATFEFDVAYSFHRNINNNNVQNVNYALQRIAQLQQWYNNGLPLVNCVRPTACVQNCVYPGDMNNNGIASDFDLLDWGVGMGQNLSIAPRAISRDNWFPYALPAPATNGYLDANGNGILDNADWNVNTNHLGNTHALYTGAVEGSNAVGNELFFKRWYYHSFFPFGNPTYDTIVHVNSELVARIHLGEATQRVDNLYGLVFEVEYDPAVLEPYFRGAIWNRSPNMTNWLGGRIRERLLPGKLHYVNVRTDGQGVDSSGMLGELRFRVKADAPVTQSIMNTNICFRNFKAIDSSGAVIPIGAMCTTVEYYDSNYVTSVRPLEGTDAYQAVLYPNPTQGATTLELTLETAQALTIQVFDLTGRVVYNYPVQKLPAGSHQLTLPTTGLPAGVYHCRIASEQRQQVLPLLKAH